MPFSYPLQKPLETGSNITIRMKMDNYKSGDIVIHLVHVSQYNNADCMRNNNN
jgi:hypothetical protein